MDEFIRVIRENKAERRVNCASFHYSNLCEVRRKAPDILTSITTKEVIPLLIRQKLNILPKEFKRKIIFQVPRTQAGISVVTPSFVKEMHKRGAVVMVWTINEEEDMRHLQSIGADCIMSDKPDLCYSVLRGE